MGGEELPRRRCFYDGFLKYGVQIKSVERLCPVDSVGGRR